MQKFKNPTSVWLPIRIPWGGLFIVGQSFAVASLPAYAIRYFYPALFPVALKVFLLLAILVCVVFTYLIVIGLSSWLAVILGIFSGIASSLPTFKYLTAGSLSPYYLLLPLGVSYLVTCLVYVLTPRKSTRMHAVLDKMHVLVLAHVVADVILISSLISSLFIHWIRPLVVAQLIGAILSWSILGTCAFTIVELNLSNRVPRSLGEDGFILHYGYKWFGLRIAKRGEKLIDLIFYIVVFLIILSWFVV